MKKILLNTVAASTLAFSANAFAFPIDLEVVSGTWTSPMGGTDVNGEGTSQIRWGNDIGNGQSGYDFASNPDLPLSIEDNSPFKLGTFTHLNRRITGGEDAAITGVNLNIMAEFGGFETGAHTFQFFHDETPNTAPETSKQCSWGFFFCVKWKTVTTETGDVDDIVTIYSNGIMTSDEFRIGNNYYSLNLLGFEDGITEFHTPEGQDTSIGLMASLNVRTATVPEPGTVALLGMGLAGLGLSRRRRSA